MQRLPRYRSHITYWVAAQQAVPTSYKSITPSYINGGAAPSKPPETSGRILGSAGGVFSGMAPDRRISPCEPENSWCFARGSNPGPAGSNLDLLPLRDHPGLRQTLPSQCCVNHLSERVHTIISNSPKYTNKSQNHHTLRQCGIHSKGHVWVLQTSNSCSR